MPSFMMRTLGLFIGVVLSLLQPASSIGTMSPAQANMDESSLREILTSLRQMVQQGQLQGAAFQIYRGGKLVYQGETGYRDRELLRPFETDTIVRLLSQSKPITAIAVFQLIEQGRLSLNDKLSKFHPKFKSMQVSDGQGHTVPALRDITIRDLLLHTAGLGYSQGFGTAQGAAGLLETLRLPYTSLEEFVNELAEQPLYWQPGSAWHYSWAYDVLGFVIQKVSGLSPDIFMRSHLFAPLKMYDTDFYVPLMKLDRFAVVYTMNPLLNGQLIAVVRPRTDPLQAYRPPPWISCGSGIVSTLNDFGRLAMMLLNGGELEGVRVLRPETVDLMWRNGLDKAQLPLSLNGWTSDGNTGWALGGFTISGMQPITTIDWDAHRGANRTGAVGWGGGMMTNWLASADADLIVNFATQRLATPIPNTFQEVVVSGALKALKGPSPRRLPDYTPSPQLLPQQTQTVEVDASGQTQQTGVDAQTVPMRGQRVGSSQRWPAQGQDTESHEDDAFLLPRANPEQVKYLVAENLPNQGIRFTSRDALLGALERQKQPMAASGPQLAITDSNSPQSKDTTRRFRSGGP